MLVVNSKTKANDSDHRARSGQAHSHCCSRFFLEMRLIFRHLLEAACVHVYIVHKLCTEVVFTIFALSLVPRSPLPRNETSFYHGHSWFILVLGSLWDVGMKCVRITWLAA